MQPAAGATQLVRLVSCCDHAAIGFGGQPAGDGSLTPPERDRKWDISMTRYTIAEVFALLTTIGRQEIAKVDVRRAEARAGRAGRLETRP